MRAIRGKVGVVAALVLAVALALSALAGLGTRPTGIPDEGPWAIALSYPEGDWSSCLDDPAMAEALMSSDLPVSRGRGAVGSGRDRGGRPPRRSTACPPR